MYFFFTQNELVKDLFKIQLIFKTRKYPPDTVGKENSIQKKWKGPSNILKSTLLRSTSTETEAKITCGFISVLCSKK